MRSILIVFAGAGLLMTGCAKSDVTHPVTTGSAFRVVNAYTGAVDVLVDGTVAQAAVAAGTLDTIAVAEGTHSVALRPVGTTSSASLSVQAAAPAMPTVAAIRLNGSIAASDLADTNAIVPGGATKVRVIHLAPNAGEIQVFRTQPDWSTPIEWQFPFLYDSVITSISNPYVQSTNGTWDIRAWRKPSEVALGWDGTTAKVTLNLASGEKATVLVLDKPGGGIQLSVIQ